MGMCMALDTGDRNWARVLQVHSWRGSPQSTYSSGGQLLVSRLVSHIHTVAEASAGYQYGSQLCWGKGREGLEREQGESWCLQMEKSLGGNLSGEICRGPAAAVLPWFLQQ